MYSFKRVSTQSARNLYVERLRLRPHVPLCSGPLAERDQMRLGHGEQGIP